MDPAKALAWWLEREGPDCVPVIEIGSSMEVRSLREDIDNAIDEITLLRNQLDRVASVIHRSRSEACSAFDSAGVISLEHRARPL